MKLYGSPTSPYVRKVRVLLHEKNIACEFIVSDPWDKDSIVPQHNPLGKVPVLELDEGTPLFDSPVIVEYLDAQEGEPLIPRSGESRWQVLRWQALADGALDAVVTRLLETRRPPEKQSAETMAHQECKIARVGVRRPNRQGRDLPGAGSPESGRPGARRGARVHGFSLSA